MKTIKKITWMAVFAIAALQVKAQTKPATGANERNSYDQVNNENGKRTEEIQMWLHDQVYKVKLVNDQVTALSVSGEEIPESDWGKYGDDIAAIKEQIKLDRIQEKKNEEQAKLNEIQAKKNEEQARLNKLQEEKNQEQVARNEDQVRLNQQQDLKNAEQAKRNEEQARLNKIQEEKNAEQAKRNEQQARLNKLQEEKNREQAARNDEQAVRNQEQEKRNAMQAKKNAEQARRNEEFIKSITDDLVADRIIPDANSLHKLTFNSDEMIVNGVKQPEEVHRKYAEKYQDFVKGNFSFSNDDTIPGN